MSKSIIEIFEEEDIHYNPKERDNVYIDCPFCHSDEKLSVNIYTGAWHCWDSSCETGSEEFTDLTKKLKIGKPRFVAKEAPVKQKRLSAEEKRVIAAAQENKAEVIEWAASRSLDAKPLLQWGVGYWKEKRCIIIPFRDPKTWKLIGARCRGDNGNQWLIGREPSIFVLDQKDLKNAKTIIVEGEPDTFTLKQFGFPVVGVLGVTKVGGLELLRSVKHPYLAYDMDDAGEDGVEKALVELGPYRCKRVHWTSKDPNDMLKQGATKKDFLECLRNAKTPEIELMSKKGDSAIDTYLDLKKVRDTANKMYWGYEGLDKCTKGLLPGWTIFLMMEGGFGKTTLLLNVLVNNVLDGVKVGIASFEEDPEAEITPKLMAMFVERNPGGSNFDKKEVEYAREDMDNVFIYPDADADILKFQAWVRECYYVHGVRLIVADYLQMMVNEGDGQQKLKKDCYAVGKDLCNEMNDLRIIWAVQPKQLLASMDKKTGEKKRARLSMHDARGGTVIQQSCDVFLIGTGIDSNITQYEFEKVRGQLIVEKKDWLYKITQLEYDHRTLRQNELKNLVFAEDDDE